MRRLAMPRAALRLESLSDRVVPSATWVEEAGVLTITGDSRANDVEITDDGTTLTITCDGEAVELEGDVTEIVLKLGSGNDTVSYTLTGSLAADAARTLDVSLGNGHDSFTATLADGAGLGDNATLNVVARGMNGHDDLAFEALAADVGAGASLSVELGGGNGKDTLSYAYGGVLLGDLFLSASGGNGKDELSGDLAFAAGSTGTAEAEVLGGNGNDQLALFVADDSGDDGDDTTADASTLADLLATADGGRGPDFADVSEGVEVIAAKTV